MNCDALIYFALDSSTWTTVLACVTISHQCTALADTDDRINQIDYFKHADVYRLTRRKLELPKFLLIVPMLFFKDLTMRAFFQSKIYLFLHALAQNSTATKSVVPSCVAKAVRSRSTLWNARNQEKWKNHKSAGTVETRKAACLLLRLCCWHLLRSLAISKSVDSVQFLSKITKVKFDLDTHFDLY